MRAACIMRPFRIHCRRGCTRLRPFSFVLSVLLFLSRFPVNQKDAHRTPKCSYKRWYGFAVSVTLQLSCTLDVHAACSSRRDTHQKTRVLCVLVVVEKGGRRRRRRQKLLLLHLHKWCLLLSHDVLCCYFSSLFDNRLVCCANRC